MLLYIAVIKNQSIVAEYSDQTGDFADLALKILRANELNAKKKVNNQSKDRQQIPNNQNFFIIPYDSNIYNFYFLVSDGFSLLVLANKGFIEDSNDFSKNETKEESMILMSKTKEDNYFENNNEKILLFLESLNHNITSNIDFSKDDFSLANPNRKIQNLLKNSFSDFNLMTSSSKDFGADKFRLIEDELELIKKEKYDLLQKLVEKDLDIETIYNKSESLKMSSWNIRQSIKFTASKVKKDNSWNSLVIFITLFLVSLIILLNYNIIMSYISFQTTRNNRLNGENSYKKLKNADESNLRQYDGNPFNTNTEITKDLDDPSLKQNLFFEENQFNRSQKPLKAQKFFYNKLKTAINRPSLIKESEI